MLIAVTFRGHFEIEIEMVFKYNIEHDRISDGYIVRTICNSTNCMLSEVLDLKCFLFNINDYQPCTMC